MANGAFHGPPPKFEGGASVPVPIQGGPVLIPIQGGPVLIGYFDRDLGGNLITVTNMTQKDKDSLKELLDLIPNMGEMDFKSVVIEMGKEHPTILLESIKRVQVKQAAMASTQTTGFVNNNNYPPISHRPPKRTGKPYLDSINEGMYHQDRVRAIKALRSWKGLALKESLDIINCYGSFLEKNSLIKHGGFVSYDPTGSGLHQQLRTIFDELCLSWM